MSLAESNDTPETVACGARSYDWCLVRCGDGALSTAEPGRVTAASNWSVTARPIVQVAIDTYCHDSAGLLMRYLRYPSEV